MNEDGEFEEEKDGEIEEEKGRKRASINIF
jgi:hypothetical protein